MPDKIKMYYSKLRNMGDCLNELIVKECFGYEAERHSFLDGEICGMRMGSFLSGIWNSAPLEESLPERM